MNGIEKIIIPKSIFKFHVLFLRTPVTLYLYTTDKSRKLLFVSRTIDTLIMTNCYLNISCSYRERAYAFAKYYKQGHCITETGFIQFVDSLGELFIFIDDVFELKNKMRLSKLIDVNFM
jgi:hypothetical protein